MNATKTPSRINSTARLNDLFRALEEFRKLDPTMPSQTAAIFLYVAVHPGCTMKDVAEALGTSESSVSRNVSALSDWHRLKRPGLGLVTKDYDPYELRRRIINLTPKGQRVLNSLSAIME